MVLGVWNNHTRLLLPSAETTPKSWRNWREVVDTIVARRRGGWKTDDRSDMARVRMDLSPCSNCARNVRALSVSRRDMLELPKTGGGDGIHVLTPQM